MTLIGKVGVCSLGRPGLITGQKQLPWGLSWIGIGLDGQSQWSSGDPRILTVDEISKLKCPEDNTQRNLGSE